MNIHINGVEISFAVPVILAIIGFAKWYISRTDIQTKKKNANR